MTTSKGKEIIDSGWKAAGISDAVKLGSSKLPPIDPFHDIDPMLGDESESSNRHLLALCDVTDEEFELLCAKKLNGLGMGGIGVERLHASLVLFLVFVNFCLTKKEKRKKRKLLPLRKFFP